MHRFAFSARRPIAAIALCCACGRVGFEPLTSDGNTDAAADAAVAAWTLVHATGAKSSNLTVPASGSGNLIVVAIQTNQTPVTSVMDDAPGGGNAYAAIPAARAIDATSGYGLELWFALASKPGAAQITVAGGSPLATVAWEVAGIATAGALDAAVAQSSSPANASPLGPTITSTVAGDFIVSAVVTNVTNVLAIHPGNAFANDVLTNTNGWAHLAATRAPVGAYQAQWDTNGRGNATYCSSAAAFLVGP